MYALAKFLADSINYIVIVLLLVSAWRGTAGWNPWRFLLVSGLAIGVACWLAEEGKRMPVWPGHFSFPSGHETFALSAASSLVYADRRWLVVALPLVILMAWALVAAHYHIAVDVLGSWLVGPPVTFACQCLLNPTKKATQIQSP